MADKLETRVLSAKHSQKEMELLLTEYRPFIVSAVLSVCPTGGDDAFQTGFIAFMQTVKLYDEEKGEFLSFAKTIIRRRVVEFIRGKENDALENDSFEGFQCVDDSAVQLSSAQVYRLNTENRERREEILRLTSELSSWSITLGQLTKTAFRQEDIKSACNTIIYEMLNNKKLLELFKKEKKLPAAELMHETGIRRKIIEDHKSYIVAAIIIHTGDFPYMREYIKIN